VASSPSRGRRGGRWAAQASEARWQRVRNRQPDGGACGPHEAASAAEVKPSQDALFGFLTETLATLEGVHGWQASMELLTVRRGFVETPWWRRELEGHLSTSMPLPQAAGQSHRHHVTRSSPGSP